MIHDFIILGILNVTPDSFSDGGKFLSIPKAIQQAKKMREAGANLIDIGGESTRPGAKQISIQTELKRVLPVIKKLKAHKFKISLDSHKPEIAETCLPYIDWLNDVEGLANPAMRKLSAQSGKPTILMHSTEIPVNPKRIPKYKNIVADLKKFFQERTMLAQKEGVKKGQIILDPGIGFGKSQNDNLKLIANLQEFVKLGYPVCLGASRKSFIGKLDGSPADKRLGGSLAATILAYQQGVQILRVHDVTETVQALKITAKVKSVK